MQVGQKIDASFFMSGHRPFDDMQGLVNAVRPNPVVWSWGAHAWTKMNDFCLRFKVNGHHHKGYVYLVVNGSDLFDIYLTKNNDKITKIIDDVYIENLIRSIDEAVERLPSYKV
jgi:hypothetical protein